MCGILRRLLHKKPPSLETNKTSSHCPPHEDQARCADTAAPDASPDLRGTRSDPIDNLLEKLKEQRRLNWSG